jgi:hypothetical protein
LDFVTSSFSQYSVVHSVLLSIPSFGNIAVITVDFHNAGDHSLYRRARFCAFVSQCLCKTIHFPLHLAFRISNPSDPGQVFFGNTIIQLSFNSYAAV